MRDEKRKWEYPGKSPRLDSTEEGDTAETILDTQKGPKRFGTIETIEKWAL